MTKRGGIHDRAFLASNSERQCSLINPEAQSVVTVFCGSGGALSSPRTQPLVLALDQKLSVRNRVTTFQTGGGGVMKTSHKNAIGRTVGSAGSSVFRQRSGYVSLCCIIPTTLNHCRTP